MKVTHELWGECFVYAVYVDADGLDLIIHCRARERFHLVGIEEVEITDSHLRTDLVVYKTADKKIEIVSEFLAGNVNLRELLDFDRKEYEKVVDKIVQHSPELLG